MQTWRWTKRLVGGLVGLLILTAAIGSLYQWDATRRELVATPPPGRLVDVGGHRLHIWCTGSGRPAVIHEAGLGGGAFGWVNIRPEIAAFTEVCTYDRAGMGYSDPGPMPRTSGQIATELAALIDESGIEPPVVLVGSSSGGYSVRIVASEHADRVAGLVLLDGAHEDQGARYEAAGFPSQVPLYAPLVPIAASLGVLRLVGFSPGASPGSAPETARDYVRATAFRTSRARAMASELLHVRESGDQVGATRRRLDVPLVVVSRRSGRDARDRIWHELQRDQLALSKPACHITAARAEHGIAGDQPELVVAAIRAVVETARDPALDLGNWDLSAEQLSRMMCH